MTSTTAITARAVQQAYLALVRARDLETAYRLYADDAIARIPGRSRTAGLLHGREAIRDYIESAREIAKDHIDVEVVDVMAGDERFVLILREVFQVDGRRVEINRANVYRVANGEIVELVIYEGNQYEVDALFAAAR